MLATRLVREPFFADLRWADELFNRVFAMNGTNGNGNGNGNGGVKWMPFIDVRETDDEYLFFVDLPGVTIENVSIEYDDSVLTISGERAAVNVGEAQRIERPYGHFVRSLTLPRGIDADEIVAEVADGVLQLRVPKPAEHKPKKIALTSGNKALTS